MQVNIVIENLYHQRNIVNVKFSTLFRLTIVTSRVYAVWVEGRCMN